MFFGSISDLAVLHCMSITIRVDRSSATGLMIIGVATRLLMAVGKPPAAGGLLVTPEQVESGLEEERHELEVANPPRERADDTLHVHFLPGNQVRLAWNHSAGSPLAEELRQQYPRKANDNP